MNADCLRLHQSLDVCLSIAALYSGEKLLWLSKRGDRLRDEVHTADLRDHWGKHPLDGHQSSSVAGLAGQMETQTRSWGFIVLGETQQAGLDMYFAKCRNYQCDYKLETFIKWTNFSFITQFWFCKNWLGTYPPWRQLSNNANKTNNFGSCVTSA